MSISLHHGDCLEAMKGIPAGSVDMVLADPPYGINFMGKDWDKGVPGVHFWVEMIRVLKPGGYLLSFSGTRTYHRMATAIEDAGFEVRDMIEWVYGSGFPKSLNVGKAVDKLQGNERVFSHKNPANRPYNLTKGETSTGWQSPPRPDKTKGTSEWEGWGTALKPAHEPICMARKPLAEKTVAENVLKYGTGGINIDESRVGTSDKYSYPNGAGGNSFSVGEQPDGKRTEPVESNALGRFPANLIHDNSEEVRECFPNESERFFKSIIYQAKASKSDRGVGNTHATVKPTALMEYLIKMASREGANILDPFMGSGTTGIACKNLNRNFIGIELDPEYFKIAEERIKAATE